MKLIVGLLQQDGGLCDNSSWLPGVSYYHKTLHLGWCSSPRSASAKIPKKQEKKSWHKLYTKTLYIECLYLTSGCFSTSLNLKWKVSQINLTLTTGVYIFKNYLILSQQNDKNSQLIHVKCTLKWCNQNKLFFLTTSLKGKSYDLLFLLTDFYLLKTKFCTF